MLRLALLGLGSVPIRCVIGAHKSTKSINTDAVKFVLVRLFPALHFEFQPIPELEFFCAGFHKVGTALRVLYGCTKRKPVCQTAKQCFFGGYAVQIVQEVRVISRRGNFGITQLITRLSCLWAAVQRKTLRSAPGGCLAPQPRAESPTR